MFILLVIYWLTGCVGVVVLYFFPNLFRCFSFTSGMLAWGKLNVSNVNARTMEEKKKKPAAGGWNVPKR